MSCDRFWAYWETPKNRKKQPYIELCHKYMEYTNKDKFQLVTPENLFDFVDEKEIPKKVFELPIVPKQDYFRTYLLHKHGGMYSDSDCIHIRSVYDDLYTSMVGTQFEICAHFPNTAFIGAIKGSQVLGKSLETFKRILHDYKGEKPFPRARLGANTVGHACNINKLNLTWRVLELKKVTDEENRIKFKTLSDPDTKEILLWFYGCNNYDKYYKPKYREQNKRDVEFILDNKAKAVMLYNHYMQAFRHKSIDQVLNSKGLMFDIFRHMEEQI